MGKNFSIVKDTLSRRMIRDSVAIGKTRPLITLAREVDISETCQKLAQLKLEKGTSISVFVYLLHCYAKSLAAFPQAHALLDYRANRYIFDHVDMMVPMQFMENGNPSLKHALIRKANTLTLQELSDKIFQAKNKPFELPFLSQRIFLRLPFFLRKLVYGMWDAFPLYFKHQAGTAFCSYLQEAFDYEENDPLLASGPLMHSAGLVATKKTWQTSQNGAPVKRDSISFILHLDHRVADGMIMLQLGNHLIDLLRKGEAIDALLAQPSTKP